MNFFFLFFYACHECMEGIEGKKKMHVQYIYIGLFMNATMCEKEVNVMHVAMNDMEKGN